MLVAMKTITSQPDIFRKTYLTTSVASHSGTRALDTARASYTRAL